jgi:uncharacterized membrane protein
MSANPKTNRLAFLDWARGLAALTMLNGHVFHSFMHPDYRNDGPYVLTQFIGGMPPAAFLFLTGITLAFLMDSRSRAGDSAWQRITSTLARARYLLILAVLFRLQMWLFSFGRSPWTDLFKVDILNSMALGIAAMAPLALFTTAERVRVGIGAGLGIALASPLISALPLASLSPFLGAWFVPSAEAFSFFPWAAFIAFGVAGGSILRLAKPESYDKLMLWSGFFGLALWAGGRFFSDLPYSIYAKSNFWLDGPWLVLIKTGILLMILPLAFVWTRWVNPHGWSVLKQLGTTSLLVYWVHTEMVYGSWFWWMKENLNLAQTLLMSVFVIASMVALSVAKTGWKSVPGVGVWLRRQYAQWQQGRLAQVPAAGD